MDQDLTAEVLGFAHPSELAPEMVAAVASWLGFNRVGALEVAWTQGDNHYVPWDSARPVGTVVALRASWLGCATRMESSRLRRDAEMVPLLDSCMEEYGQGVRRVRTATGR